MASTTPKKKPAPRKRAPASTSASKRTTPAVRPLRREIGAVSCLLLALFAGFGYFNISALFIDFFCGTLKSLFGYGFWVAPPALLLAAYILAFHRGRPVRGRLCCALLLPLFLGSILHLFLSKNLYPWSWEMVRALGDDGILLKSGGMLSGLIAISFEQVFSKAGAAIIFILGALLMALAACNRTVVDIVDAIRNRPRVAYEPTPAPEPRRRTREVAPTPIVSAPAPTPTPVSAIDIPVEDGPLVGVTPPTLVKKKEKFFDRMRRVPMPDEVLTGAASRPPVEEEPTPAPQPEPEPVSTPAPEPEPELIPITREPAVQKVKPEETARAADEVRREIADTMEQAAPAYQYPPISLLAEGDSIVGAEALGELRINQDRLTDTIRSFGIEAKIEGVVRGPSVTRYELELDQGVRLNRLTNLADDIALALGATGVRIAPIPNKISMVGIEVPNRMVSAVNIHEVIDSKDFRDQPSKVSFAVGKDIGGNCIVGNIAKLPHLLIAGTTGSGKSVCTNSLIVSLLYKATPEEVRLIMVDPKMVELGIYNGIPHLLIPVVTDPKKASGALQWAVVEMMKRYRTFSEAGVRDLASYNQLAAKSGGEMEKMPQIVVVIDELADLMLVAAKEVEESICRVAQMGRASGMHLVIATQRPSADVITGLMKANIPSRIAFAVSSAMESRIILDTQGAEKLVGRGDMLWFPLGAGKPLRVQGCLIADDEVAAVVDFVKQRGGAEYDESVIHEIDKRAEEKDKGGKSSGGSAAEDEGDYDELLPAAIEVVLEIGQASVSMLQRRLKLGYGRAARLVDQMEEKGVVGPFEGSKPRQLLITKAQWQEMQYRSGAVAAAPDDFPADNDADEDDDTPPFDA